MELLKIFSFLLFRFYESISIKTLSVFSFDNAVEWAQNKFVWSKDKIWQHAGTDWKALNKFSKWARTGGYILVRVCCWWPQWGKCHTHFAYLSGITMSRLVERCSRGNVTGNPAIHCNFGVKIQCILHLLPPTQNRVTTYCTVHLCTHMAPFLCMFFLSVLLSSYT